METMIRKITGRYLTFSLAGGEYGVEIQKVREILEPAAVEIPPGTAATVAGVIRLRNRTVPVLDLRACLGLEQRGAGAVSCILTVVVRSWNGPVQMGLLVDGIREVVQVSDRDLEEKPGIEAGCGEHCPLQTVQCEDRLICLLDVDCLAEEEKIQELNFINGGSHEFI